MTISNAIDPTTAKRFVGEIDRCFDELLSLRGEYMNECKQVRERIKEWKEKAASAGLPRSGLNHLLKRRDLEAKLKGHEADAEPEVVETADMIREALGDFAALPLGGAAVEAAGGVPDAPKAKRGRPAKKAGVPLAGEDDGSDPLSKIGRGLN